MPIVRLPNGELRDEIRQTVYDTIDLEGGVSPKGTHVFFSNVQGKHIPIKTNLTSNGMFETAKSYRMQGLCLDSSNFRLANFKVLPMLMEKSGLRLKIGEKIYWEGPARFAAGRMYQNAMTTTAATDLLFQQYGEQAIQAVVFSGRHTIDINPLQQFSLSLYVDELTVAEEGEITPAPDTVLSLVASLKGLLRRPVQ